MKLLLQFYIAFLIIPCISYTQENRSFEGRIIYDIQVVIENASDLNKYYQEKYGDSVTVHISKKGDYLKKYYNTGNFGYDFILYDNESKNLYTKFNSIDTLFFYNVRSNFVKLRSEHEGRSEIVLGEKCKSYIIDAYDPISNQPAIFTYYYSGQPFIKPSIYTGYKDFFYDRVMNKLKSVFLKMEMNLGSHIVLMEALQIKEITLDNKTFKVPRKYPLKEI